MSGPTAGRFSSRCGDPQRREFRTAVSVEMDARLGGARVPCMGTPRVLAGARSVDDSIGSWRRRGPMDILGPKSVE